MTMIVKNIFCKKTLVLRLRSLEEKLYFSILIFDYIGKCKVSQFEIHCE